MKTLIIYVSKKSGSALYSSCTLEIPGVGTVEIKDLISLETFDRLSKEAEANARIKMGMKIEEVKESAPLT